MQIRHQIAKLLLGERVAQGRHHLAAMNDALLNKLIIGEKPAGKVLLLIESLQAGAFPAPGAVGAVTEQAILFVDPASLGLLGS